MISFASSSLLLASFFRFFFVDDSNNKYVVRAESGTFFFLLENVGVRKDREMFAFSESRTRMYKCVLKMKKKNSHKNASPRSISLWCSRTRTHDFQILSVIVFLWCRVYRFSLSNRRPFISRRTRIIIIIIITIVKRKRIHPICPDRETAVFARVYRPYLYGM